MSQNVFELLVCTGILVYLFGFAVTFLAGGVFKAINQFKYSEAVFLLSVFLWPLTWILFIIWGLFGNRCTCSGCVTGKTKH